MTSKLLTNDSTRAPRSSRLARSSTERQQPDNPAEQTERLVAITVEVRLLQTHLLVRRELARVRGIACAQAALDPARRRDNGAFVGEGVETSTPVVAAGARLADTTKREVGDGDVHEGVVDGDTAGANSTEDWKVLAVDMKWKDTVHTLFNFLLGSERIHTKRRAVDIVRNLDRLVEVVDRQDCDNRAEGLILHQRVLDRLNLDDGRLDEPLLLVHLSTDKNLAVAAVNQRLHPVERTLVDHAAVIRRVLGSIGIVLLQRQLELRDQLGDDRLVREDIILRGANLARVEGLAPDESPGRESQVCILSDERGITTTQLQKHRCQRRSSGLGYDLADAGAAREADLVPALGEQGLGLGDAALDHGVAVWVERCFHDLLHHDSAVARRLAGFDDDGVSGGDGADERAQGKLEGDVEGTAKGVVSPA